MLSGLTHPFKSTPLTNSSNAPVMWPHRPPWLLSSYCLPQPLPCNQTDWLMFENTNIFLFTPDATHGFIPLSGSYIPQTFAQSYSTYSFPSNILNFSFPQKSCPDHLHIPLFCSPFPGLSLISLLRIWMCILLMCVFYLFTNSLQESKRLCWVK